MLNDRPIAYQITKRLLDITVSLVGLVVLSPVVLVVSVWIKRDSPGPAFFRQRRIGLGNREFMISKFRTMYHGTPEVAKDILLKRGIETYYTRAGQFLRRNSLDEIPQLINVLRGEMSLVGPRPALYNQHDLIRMRTERGVHLVKPGMTGWAIIQGGEDLTLEQKVSCDEYYLQQRSFWFDLNILRLTFRVMRKQKGIY